MHSAIPVLIRPPSALKLPHILFVWLSDVMLISKACHAMNNDVRLGECEFSRMREAKN